MPRRKPNKYSRKYCKQLQRGLRKDGKSIVEICQLWDISTKTYYEWIKEHGEFAEAHEVGQRDEQAYWHKLCRRAAEGEIKTNGTILKVAASVMLGWTEKVVVDHNKTQPINTIKIELIDVTRKPVNVIEYKDAQALEYVEDVRDYDIVDKESN